MTASQNQPQDQSQTHWHGQSKQWSRIGGQLRPCAEDVALMRAALGDDLGVGLLLGVTPELTSLSDEMIAMDNNEGMLKRLWEEQPGHKAVLSDWLEMSKVIEHAGVDFAVGDGSLSLVEFPQNYYRLFTQLNHAVQAVRPGGKIVLRLFVSPEQSESVAQVMNAARSGKIGNFHAFKWRFFQALIALQNGNPNIAVAAVLDEFNRQVTDRDTLAQQAGWPREDIDTIDVYAGSAAIYNFPTLSQVRAALPRNWQIVDVRCGTYELAERCPVVTIQRRETDIVWPPFVADTVRDVVLVRDCLLETERLSSAEIEAGQLRQLKALATHAAEHSPHFAARLQVAGMKAEELSSMEALRRLPLLSRRDLQQDIAQIECLEAAAAHGPFGTVQTSGSSGEPVKLKRTAINQSFWLANTMREHQWHNRDFSGRLAVMRANLKDNKPVVQDDWGVPATLFTATGPGYAMPINADVSQQVEWLNDVSPHYLMIYPNNLAALLDEVEAGHLKLSALKEIRSIGETMPEALRHRASQVLGVTVADVYSSQELGMISAQCAENGLHHVMEGMLLEVLDENGHECAPGEVGRVVITDLHNYVTPLFRYDIGDYAEVGPACTCGRGLKTLRRVMGRERNMMKLPNGERRWPLVGFHRYREIAPIVQYQLIQHSYEKIEVRLVVSSPLTAEHEQALTEVIDSALGHKFELEFVYFDGKLPIGANGKFEEFVCKA